MFYIRPTFLPKGRNKKVDKLGSLGPEEQHSGEFLKVSFSLMYPGLEAVEAGSPEMSTHEKNPN